jgi:hypothetical protein
MKKILYAIVFLIYTCASSAGQETHGGDAVVSDFLFIAYSAQKKCEQSKNQKELPPHFCKKFLLALDKTFILSSEKVELNQNEVDAINMPTNNPPQIVINRSRWLSPLYSDEYKENLAVHEYLSILQIDDKNYLTSRKIIKILNNNK